MSDTDTEAAMISAREYFSEMLVDSYNSGVSNSMETIAEVRDAILKQLEFDSSDSQSVRHYKELLSKDMIDILNTTINHINEKLMMKKTETVARLLAMAEQMEQTDSK